MAARPVPVRAAAGRRRSLGSGMPSRQRFAVYLVFGALWLSGCVWLGLDQFFSRPGQFGLTPHPWEPPILLAAGVMAILSTYLLGWVTARHVLKWWPVRLRRLSGGALAAMFFFLTLSGFALFFVSDDRWQRVPPLRTISWELPLPRLRFSTGSLPGAATCAVPLRGPDSIPVRHPAGRSPDIRRRRAPNRCASEARG
jgi:hypothetical protein